VLKENNYMKFIITEEQNEKFNQKIKSIVNKYGYEEALRIFDKNLEIIRRTYQDNPLEFLDQFNDLRPIEKGDRTYYVDENRIPLLYYITGKNRLEIFISYDIWGFFSVLLGFKNSEIQEILREWLGEIYGIKVLTLSRIKLFTPTMVDEDL